MATDGIHYLVLNKAKARYSEVQDELVTARQQLAEAVEMGDLRENSEYDSAKTQVSKLVRESEELQPVMTMQAVRANDGITVIKEGSVVEISIYQLTKTPVRVGTAEFEELKKLPPVFHGVLAFGAALSFHELLVDNILHTETPVGKFLLGKKPGDYSVPVTGGFSNLTVSKVFNVEDANELFCEIGGVRHVEEV